MRIRLKLISWLVGAALVVAALVVVWCVRSAGDPGHLSAAQWSRLSERFVRRATLRRRPPAATEAPTVLPSPSPTAAAVRPSQPIPDPQLRTRQAAEYSNGNAKTVVELQQFRSSQSIGILDAADRPGTATLINLNPMINAWYLLHLQWADGGERWYHLANARPDAQDIELDPDFPGGLVVADSLLRTRCSLWSAEADPSIDVAVAAGTPYVMLCADQMVLRLPTSGSRTALEWTTDFLRDNVWGGEKITVFVRNTLFKDAFVKTSDLVDGANPSTADGAPSGSLLPMPPRINPDFANATLAPVDLGIALENDEKEMRVGRWYAVRDNPGISLSALQPRLVAPEILAGHRALAGTLDEVEQDALAYLVAFDLELFEVGYSIGTDHPRVGWSERVPEAAHDPSLPGPDGIGEIAPLVATGMIPPAAAERTAATFTGGFKRSHGAFARGTLALVNHGSHYGFVESGVVLSKLQPGLSTLLVTDAGRVEMKTWQAADDARLAHVRHARQNGVTLVEPDPETGAPMPGALVSRWGFGNWSGSQDKRFRTLRAGACLQETGTRRFLIYGYFSGATPSAMARVFQAYQCSYAMLLDINALEHTYLALYHADGNQLVVEHLITGMEVLDKQVAGTVLPRFLGFADNRDFFYMLRRKNGVAKAPAGGVATEPAGGR